MPSSPTPLVNISVVMYTDTRQAGLSDDLDASVNYGDVSQFIGQFFAEHTFQLIEKVAEQLAQDRICFYFF